MQWYRCFKDAYIVSASGSRSGERPDPHDLLMYGNMHCIMREINSEEEGEEEAEEEEENLS